MPLTGTLRSWNEERGFGFIAPTHGGAEIFVHVSALSRDGTKPSVGEKFSYELDRGRDGKPQAVKVVRLAVGTTRPRRLEGATTSKSQTSWLGVLLHGLTVSHETVYAAIYAVPRGDLRTELASLLRKSSRRRLPHARGQGRCTGLQDMTSIALRLPEVAARTIPGHREGDLIKGAMNRSAVDTIVERLSRYVMFVMLDSASAVDVLNGFTRRLRSIPPGLR
jgi:cold shock CspA family protein